MGRYSRNKYDSYGIDENNPDQQYNMAYRRMRRIKGFYIHLVIYILINSYNLVSIFNQNIFGDAVFWKWNTWSVIFFWGIGLTAHGLSVFGRDLFFGADWEEKKIQEFMDKNKNDKWE